MFWLYFARDFYRMQQSAASQGQMPTPSYVPEVRNEAPQSSTSAPPETSASVASVPSASSWSQRLSVEGDHAFGVWDSECGFSIFSANFERVTALSSAECAGHDWIHTIHNDQQYAVNEALLNAEKGIDSQCLVQACSRYREESWRWLLLDVKAARADQPHVMVLWRDLSEQHALEETLRQLETALAMSERGRSAFLSSMSHELRTPLNAIMGFSEMMKSGVFGKIENPTYQQYAEHIHDSGTMLLAKINDLLDIASMDAGGLEIEESEFALMDLMNEAIEMHSHQAFSRNQRIHLDCPLKLTMMADRAKLLCATSHLISNALRHSQNDDEVILSVRVQADEGVIISVRDGGEGISHAQLEVIRKAMEADVAYFNIECGGVGLGLSMVKELAARHGGKVMIDSIRHRGTVASIILPTSRVMRGMPEKKKQRHS
jgi:signal transduction histidine kinase